jgi:hypothetical protein
MWMPCTLGFTGGAHIVFGPWEKPAKSVDAILTVLQEAATSDGSSGDNY